jgi:hypothetical protein
MSLAAKAWAAGTCKVAFAALAVLCCELPQPAAASDTASTVTVTNLLVWRINTSLRCPFGGHQRVRHGPAHPDKRIPARDLKGSFAQPDQVRMMGW